MRRARAVVTVLAVTLVLAVGVTPVAWAGVVPVDPGPTGAGRPIVGSGQNLPSLGATDPFDAGPGFAGEIEKYYRSGHATADQRAVARAAAAWVRHWVHDRCDGRARGCRAMVVFDIDDSLLDNYPFYSTLTPPFGYDAAAYDAFAERCGEPVNRPVRWLYRTVRDLGVRAAIISGRDESLRATTRRCLEERGIAGWHRLVLKAPGDERSAAQFKAAARRSLVRDGFRIVASVGDQVSDMADGYLKRGFLLPNPMYYLP